MGVRPEVLRGCVWLRVGACVRACVFVRVRAFVRALVCVGVCVWVWVRPEVLRAYPAGAFLRFGSGWLIVVFVFSCLSPCFVALFLFVFVLFAASLCTHRACFSRWSEVSCVEFIYNLGV